MAQMALASSLAIPTSAHHSGMRKRRNVEANIAASTQAPSRPPQTAPRPPLGPQPTSWSQ